MEFYLIPVQDGSTEEKFIIYRPLLGLAFIGNRSMAGLAQRLTAGEAPGGLSANQQDAASFLDQIGYLKPDPAPPGPPAFNVNTAVLMLTNRCQLRCVYCYAAAGDVPERVLSYASGAAVIDYVHDHALENKFSQFEVFFHGGGEPTYHWEVLKQCAAHARTRKLKARLTLTSNGIWSRQQLDWITANIDGLGVSMDGSPGTQDGQRPIKSGKPSSTIVLRNIAELDRRKFTYGVRITTIPPFDRLAADVRFICETMGCDMIQVEPAYNFQRGELAQPGEDQALQFTEAFLEAYEIARAHSRRLYYSGARPDRLTNHFCNSPYNALVVTPDDRIVGCYEAVGVSHPLAGLSTMGIVSDGAVVLDPAPRSRLYELLEQRHATCRDCFCFWSCAGDCYTRAFMDGIQNLAYHSPRCDVNRTLTQNIILAGIEDGKGVWRRPRRQLARLPF